MTWFLTLQSPANTTNQAATYELQDSVDTEALAQELLTSAALNHVVSIPAVVHSGTHQQVTVYVRPAAWGAWMFYQLSEEDRRKLAERLSALSRAAQQQQQRSAGQIRTPQGPAGPASLGPLGI